MNYLRLIFLLACSLTLSSCVGVSQMQEKLANATNKTNSIAEMQFMEIKESTEQGIIFNEETPYFDFQHGKSFYMAMSLPEPRQPRYLNIKTYLTSQYLPSAAVLVPNFLFLDENKKQMVKVDSYRLNSTDDFWKGPYFSGKVPIPANAYYLVAYASDNHVPEVRTYSANGREYVLPLSPAGSFKLTLGESLPLDYEFSTVVLKDSFEILDRDKVNFYYVKKIEDEAVENNLVNSVQRNRGRGMRIEPYSFDRELPLKDVTLTIAGKLQYGAPIQEIFNKTIEVEGNVNFTPVKNKKYVVKGELRDGYQAVWIEDLESNEIMGEKIVVENQE